ncbi:RAM signaling network component, partial [Ascosphaera atra]
MQNYVEDIPDELAGMTQLQILKISGNPLIPALRQILENKGEASNSAGEAADKEPSMTFEIKKFLKGRRQHAANSNTDPVPPTEGTYDAPRPARKGNRFPVVPSRQGSASSHDGKQLSVSSKPPPIPVRSHYRLASGSLRTGASSTLPNPNPDSNGLSERNRSKSEGRI